MRSLVLVLSLVTIAGARFSWRDCSTSPDTDAVTFHEFSVAPEAIPLPGEAHLNINLTFHRVIEHAYVDIEIYKMVFGLPLKVPCLNESMILGSCPNADLCRIFRSILNDPNHASDYGHQAEHVFFASIGHYIQCPLPAENVAVTDGVFTLYAVPEALQLLSQGDYMFRLHAKDRKDGPVNIGCIEVNATLTHPNTGTIVG